MNLSVAMREEGKYPWSSFLMGELDMEAKKGRSEPFSFLFSSSHFWVTNLYMPFYLSIGPEWLQGRGWGQRTGFLCSCERLGLRFSPLGSEYEPSFVSRSSFPLRKCPWSPLGSTGLWLGWALAISSSWESREEGTMPYSQSESP